MRYFAGSNIEEYLYRGFDMFIDAFVRGIGYVNENICKADFFQGAVKCFHKAGRQIADKADSVRQEQGLSSNKLYSSCGWIERSK